MKALKIAAIFLFIILVVSLTLLPKEIESQQRDPENLILSFYRPPANESNFKVREEINTAVSEMNTIELLTFYSRYTNDWIISRKIIEYSIELDVPLHLSFAIAWHESRFNPSAISSPNRNGSRDWGLFQLNDSYRNWTRNQFLDVSLNAREGISHFKWCHDHLEGDIIAALQAYNAGMSRVIEGRAPESTLQYVENILNYEAILDEAWNEAFNI